MRSLSLSRGLLALWVVSSVLGASTLVQAQLVPGTGNLLNYDDLEDPNWGYVHNFPKSSKEEDENIRYPLGGSNNRMWSESPKRGSPDVVKRCETPAGGLAGSKGALYLRTRDSGIPGHPMNKQAQDDFILMARPCGVGYSPNYMVRVYLPEFQDWEQRQGVSFGIRAGMQGPMTKQKELSMGKRFLRGGKRTETVVETEPYYPGFFIAFNPANAANKEAYAQILIRSDHMGNEVAGPKITQTGWWTFGMSVTPDARCHYYAHAGIADLTAKDHIYSSLPYNIRGEMFNTIFFNVCSADNGASWSTPWIIDDPRVYYAGPPVFKPQDQQQQQAQQQPPAKTVQAPTAAPNAVNATMTKELPAATPAVTPAPTTTAAPPAPLNPQSAAPMVPAAPAQPPAATPTTLVKPATIQVPVVGISAVPAPALPTANPVSVPSASAPIDHLLVVTSGPVPVTAPSSAALQQPAPVSSSPSGPVRPIVMHGVPVKAPALTALAVVPQERTSPSLRNGATIPVATIPNPTPIAAVPSPSPIPAPIPASVPVVASMTVPVPTAVAAPAIPSTTITETAPSRSTGIPVRSVSVTKIVPAETPDRSTMSPVPAPEPEAVTDSEIVIRVPVQAPSRTVASSGPVLQLPVVPVSTPVIAEPQTEAVTKTTPALAVPPLMVPTLPKEEVIPARQMQSETQAPLLIPSLPAVAEQLPPQVDKAIEVQPVPVVSTPAATPDTAAPASTGATPAAPNPFDDRKPASGQSTVPSTDAEEPPLTVLQPSVDTTGVDPAPVPTPPAAE